MNKEHDNVHSDQHTNEHTEHEKQAAAQPESCADEVAYWKEQCARVSADLANYERRVEKDRASWKRAAQLPVIEIILSFLDELDLAIKAIERTKSDELPGDLSSVVLTKGKGCEQFIEGFKLIQKNLLKRLADLGVKPIEVGHVFDPNFHEAIMTQADTGKPSGEIVNVLSTGYVYGDVVIRHAKVSVAE